MGASEPVIYAKINTFLPDLQKLGWRWYPAVGCPLIATIEEPWDGWPRWLCAAGLAIVLLLTALGLLRWLLLDPLRETLSELHPDDLEGPVLPPLL